jgi:hypothetical protein
MRKESFKEIEGFPSYEVSNYGRIVSSFIRGYRILKPQKDAMGYLHVRLYKDDESLGRYKNGAKKPKLEKVHRLVAKAFVEKPDIDQYLEVNHKDSDKTNNHYSNLEWVTRSQNIQHSYDQGNRVRLTEQLIAMKQKHVKAIFKDGTEEYFLSIVHCGLSLGITPAAINIRLRKERDGIKQEYGRKDFIIKRVEELPPGETWKMIAGIEEKILKWRQKYYPLNEEMRQKRRKYARAFRKRKQQNR